MIMGLSNLGYNVCISLPELHALSKPLSVSTELKPILDKFTTSFVFSLNHTQIMVVFGFSNAKIQTFFQALKLIVT